MKVLITGAGSYIGTHLAKGLKNCEIRELDIHSGVDEADFVGYDAVIHVAGFVHQKKTKKNVHQFYQVNRNLAMHAARAAKAQGVKQFVFLSSMSVYGMTVGRITRNTKTIPNNHYGVSKWEAENGLEKLKDDDFHIAVLRLPMVYGRGCRGNYPRLADLARRLPVFPAVQNQRSMLYIGVLVDFVQKLLESGEGGVFFPQNREYVCTSELVQEVARCSGKRIIMIRGLDKLIHALTTRVDVIGKLFGSLTYDQEMSLVFRSEDEPSFAETIRMTEGVE